MKSDQILLERTPRFLIRYNRSEQTKHRTNPQRKAINASQAQAPLFLS